MPIRLVSAGTGAARPLVCGYLIGDHLDADLRDALPGACLVAYDTPDGEPLPTTLRRARQLAGVEAFGALVLLGFSAGVGRGVRQRLIDGAKPDAVVAIDGTHASLPPLSWQIEVWRALAERARRGEALFVATHSCNTYTESLRAPHTAYQSTWTTLRQATGWPLGTTGPLPLGEETSEGDLHVHSYASATTDAAAHAKQQTVALPAMLRRYVAPWLERRSASATAPTLPPPAPVAGPRTLRLGDSGPDVGAWQRALLAAGFDPGAADGKFGPRTESSTMALQRARGLHVAGVVDAATRAAATLPPEEVPWIRARNYTDARRGTMDIVVIHSTESGRGKGTARAVAGWFAGASAPRASAHYVVGDDEVLQCVLEEDVAWAAPGGNRTGIQIELCGRASQTADEWLRGPMLGRAAALVAGICRRRGIPIVRLSPADLLAGRRGITGHVDVSRAFRESSHVDPGVNFVWEDFLEMVRRA